ncbi:MAG: hypothetical protein NTV61_10665 [Candidatus Bathyarchaeota archaeon]|nr:hypothetical protein [Candidatus Bathyarchaeota archaeon]
MFSIELKSKECLRSLSLPSESKDSVLIEGFIGTLRNLSLTEGVMLEIEGSSGVMRVELSEKELEALLPRRVPAV